MTVHYMVWDGVRYACVPAPEPGLDGAPWEDIRSQMPTNSNPDADPILAKRGGWWQRELEQITGITIHHTCSHAYLATATWIVRPAAKGGKGYSTTQYHVWVTREGRALYCVDLTEGMWHDHAGDLNRNISIGMAGSLHVNRPPQVQLDKAVEVVAYLMRKFGIPIANVAGHLDRAKLKNVIIECPGWDVMQWRAAFYDALRARAG